MINTKTMTSIFIMSTTIQSGTFVSIQFSRQEKGESSANCATKDLSGIKSKAIVRQYLENTANKEIVNRIRYENSYVIGSGFYSKTIRSVTLDTDSLEKTHHSIACKQVVKSGKNEECAMKEIAALIKLKHKNIVQILGAFEDLKDNIIVILMELASYDLLHFISLLNNNSNKIPTNEIAYISINMLSAIIFCEQNGIYHTDIHFKNWLVFNGNEQQIPQIKLADFGLYRDTTEFPNALDSMTSDTSACIAMIIKCNSEKSNIPKVYSIWEAIEKTLKPRLSTDAVYLEEYTQELQKYLNGDANSAKIFSELFVSYLGMSKFYVKNLQLLNTAQVVEALEKTCNPRPFCTLKE